MNPCVPLVPSGDIWGCCVTPGGSYGTGAPSPPSHQPPREGWGALLGGGVDGMDRRMDAHHEVALGTHPSLGGGCDSVSHLN